MKILATTVTVLIILAGGYVGYGKYQDYKFVESVTPYVKNSSLRLANGLRYETENSDSATGNIFEKIGENISEIEKNILQIQTIATPKQKSIADPIEAYLKGAQELQRALLSKHRKRLEMRPAMDLVDESFEELKTPNPYGLDIDKKLSDIAIAEISLSEYEEAITTLTGSAVKLKKLAALMPSEISSDAVIDVATIDAVISKNKPDESLNAEKKKLQIAGAALKNAAQNTDECLAAINAFYDATIAEIKSIVSNFKNAKDSKEIIDAIKKLTTLQTDTNNKTNDIGKKYPVNETDYKRLMKAFESNNLRCAKALESMPAVVTNALKRLPAKELQSAEFRDAIEKLRLALAENETTGEN